MFEQELQTARDLARRAGAVIMEHCRAGFEVERKPGDEPVTVADRAAQELIVEGLRAAFPDDGILAEESADHGTWADFPRAWLVDPLDGTKDFVAGRQGFSVMIGLLEQRAPVLGVVLHPPTGRCYWAARGHGAWVDDGGAPDSATRMRPSSVQQLSQARLAVSRSHRTGSVVQVGQQLGVADELSLGSVGLKVGLVASGDRELYVNPEGNCRLWDTCAPEALLVEAGGRVTDRHGEPLVYRPDQIRVPRGIVASNGPCHEAAIARLEPLVRGLKQV